MKIKHKFLIFIPLLVFLSGCLTFKEQVYKFDFDTGILQVNYHDLRSIKEDKDKDDNTEKDWASLIEILNKKDEYNPQVVSVKSKKIFQQGEALSGEAVYQVQCVKCFPSKLDVLKLLYKDGYWDVVNEEIFLILPSTTPLISTNGKLIKTDKNNISVWSLDEKVFEYTLSADKVEGESLLKIYLRENNQNK